MRTSRLLLFAVTLAACGDVPRLAETAQPAVVVGPATHNFGTVTVGSTSPPATFVISPAGTGDSNDRINAIVGCPGFTINAPGLPAEVFRDCGDLEPVPNQPQAAADASCPDPAVRTYSFTATFAPTLQGSQQCVGQIMMSSGVQTFTMTGTGEAPPFVVEVQPRSIDFKDIRVNDPSDVRTVTVTNLGSQALNLDVQFTGQTTEIALTKGTLGPQSLAKGTNTKLDFVCTPSATTLFSANLRVVSNDPAKPQIDVPITCNGINSELDISPTAFDAETLVNQSKLVTISLTNEGNVGGVLKTITLSNNHPAISFASPPPEGQTLEAGEATTITIEFDPMAKVSADLGSVIIEFDNDPPRTIPITGEAKLAMALTSPNLVELGAVCVGVDKETVVEVYAGDNGEFEITNATVDGAFGLAPTSLPQTLGPELDRERLTVIAMASSPGELTGTLTVTTTAPDQTQVEVPIRALGLEAGVTVDKPELVVGVIEVGGFTAAQTVTLTNCTGATVKVTDQRIVGPHAAEFVLTKAFVPADLVNAASLPIDVQFAPDAAGPREATLVLEFTGGRLEVPLFGDALGVAVSRDTYYRCSTGGADAWPLGAIALGFLLRRRRRR